MHDCWISNVNCYLCVMYLYSYSRTCILYLRHLCYEALEWLSQSSSRNSVVTMTSATPIIPYSHFLSIWFSRCIVVCVCVCVHRCKWNRTSINLEECIFFKTNKTYLQRKLQWLIKSVMLSVRDMSRVKLVMNGHSYVTNDNSRVFYSSSSQPWACQISCTIYLLRMHLLTKNCHT